MRNRETRHGEYKVRVNATLTPSSIEKLDNLAKQSNTSRSELVEQLARHIKNAPLTGKVEQLGESFAD
ncbi:ribbon-helix-helix domain-containing protein [Coleofasciculus sp. E2-BRE-01]|uniref:ribbon-helix-helix domain-containing protein n=1 Tax=Coleofasciculus sp. E2-BRE-01 TaxID=3069524 RepID=UPI0032FAD8EA